jgi:hypothetical protein
MSVKFILFEQASKCSDSEGFCFDYTDYSLGINILNTEHINESDFEMIIPLVKSFLSELEDQDSISFLNDFLEYYTHLIENKKFRVGSCLCLVLCEILYSILEIDNKDSLENIESGDAGSKFAYVFLQSRMTDVPILSIDGYTLDRLKETCRLLEQMIKEGSYPPSFELACNVLDFSFSEFFYHHDEDLNYSLAASHIFNELSSLVSDNLKSNQDLRLISHKLAFLCKSLQIIFNAPE